jgi:hypothetical protein
LSFVLSFVLLCKVTGTFEACHLKLAVVVMVVVVEEVVVVVVVVVEDEEDEEDEEEGVVVEEEEDKAVSIELFLKLLEALTKVAMPDRSVNLPAGLLPLLRPLQCQVSLKRASNLRLLRQQFTLQLRPPKLWPLRPFWYVLHFHEYF